MRTIIATLAFATLAFSLLSPASGETQAEKEKAKEAKELKEKDAKEKDAKEKDAEKRDQAVRDFMRHKLTLSNEVLEGLVTEDFGLIEKAATNLDKMSHHDKWDVYMLDDYSHFSAEYRRAARSLAKQASKKNIDGAALAYHQLNMTCIECHKFTRGVKLADASRPRDFTR